MRGFKIAHLNIKSLIKNIDQLYLLRQKYADTVTLNKTMRLYAIDNTVVDH